MRIVRRIVWRMLVLALVVVWTVGCEKSGESGGQKNSLEEAIPQGSPFEKEQLLEAARSLQGSWVTPPPLGTEKVAWRVDGAEITSWDGSEEKTKKLSVVAPCRADIVEGSTTTYYTFAIDDDRGYVGAQTGVVTSDGFAVCTTDNDVHVKNESGCKVWKREGFSWESSESECSMEGDEVTIDSADSTLERAGDIIVDENWDRHEAVSYPSFEKAKAAIDE